MYYKKIAVAERLPDIGKFVTTIDEANEHRVYRLTEFGWNMRDADGTNSPNNNLPILYWLEETDLTEMISKAEAWEHLILNNGNETIHWSKKQFEEFLDTKDWEDTIKNMHRDHFKGKVVFHDGSITY